MIRHYITLEELMKRFQASWFLAVNEILGRNVGVEKTLTSYGSRIKLTQAEAKALRNMIHAPGARSSKVIRLFANECRKLQLLTSAMKADELAEALSKRYSSYELQRLSEELCGRLADEMMTREFFCIDPNKNQYLNELNLFGSKVANAFPSAQDDIQNAGRCLAFDRWTASVFHSMRVLEIGLTALAKELGVSYDRVNWDNIINNIEAKIRKISKTTSGDEWKTKEKFYSEAALQFRYFKNAWRNHVMHVRDTYDEERAETIFEHTKQFMAHLATKLKEDVA